jgi:fatty acid desaturase
MIVIMLLLAGVFWNLFFWLLILPVIVRTGMQLGKHDARHLRRVIDTEYHEGEDEPPWLS